MEILLDRKTVFRILKNKNKLKKALKVNIDVKKDKVDFEGEPENEFIAEEVFEAIDAGFSVNKALLLVEEDYMLEKIYIREISRRKDLRAVRGRVIGKEGKVLKNISQLSGCFIELKNNELFIIGESEDVEECKTALTSLVKGSKQTNVYNYLEKNREKRKIQGDLGLK